MKFLNIFIFVLFFMGCNNKSQQNNVNTSGKQQIKSEKMHEVLDFEKIKKHIELQERVESDEKEYDNPYELTIEDLKLTSDIIYSDLADNAYIQPKSEEFNEKIKKIFSVDDKALNKCTSIDNKNGYITLFGNMMDGNPKTLEENKYDLYAATQNIFINTNGRFIHPMFLLKDLGAVSNNNSFKTKIPRYVIARNMYLFNDSKPQYKWLIINDQQFMESLVKTFGYTQDTDLLKWVIEKTRFDKNDPQNYGKLFWIKKCDSSLKLHANTFKILQKLYLPKDPSENRFILDDIQSYLEYLGEKSAENNLNEEEKVKIMANLAYFAEQYKYNSSYNDGSRIMGRLRFFLNQEDVNILIKNNYFSLPKFKEWWDNADYDEYFVEECEYNGTCGPDNKPMNITEWRKQHPKK
ncbi:hypothetical protein ACQWU4_17315 [Chryseobacterium sp. MIQD13]|uniref:hypothetical protein n=1 Tax=Chryseobacterium sp. MIQD13 TaxID=3422310 RepID=UPI003D2B7F1D